MRIRWTPAAVADLQSISDYLKEHHPHYRDQTIRKLYGTVRELKQWPGRGLPGSEEGAREVMFPPTPYVAVYRVREQIIEVMRIYQAAQNRPQDGSSGLAALTTPSPQFAAFSRSLG